MSRRNRTAENRKLVLSLAVFAGGMIAFAVVLLPPLYDVFCEVTGLGGKTDGEAAPASLVAASVVQEREVRLEFMTTVNQYAPWEFHAEVDSMIIHPGQLHEATFIARNLTDRRMVAQAVPSVAPALAARLFRKLDCFCFDQQAFEPGERKEMPVRFIVGSDLPDYVDTITLSYTFFDTARLSQAGGGD
ncbi:MAG TPA: cytochrome c oxidase assembly protein [Kiloniellaceae bacterium]|nr:cytochrome c oxidase assembly protein [Kiloniellaceae bacterium]